MSPVLGLSGSSMQVLTRPDPAWFLRSDEINHIQGGMAMDPIVPLLLSCMRRKEESFGSGIELPEKLLWT